MTIPVSSVVNVTITATPGFPSRAGFGTLNILGVSTVIPRNERIRFYSSASEVDDDFLSTTEEAKAANTYFGQNPSPTTLAISRRFTTAQAAFLVGGTGPGAIGVWTPVTDGSFNIDIDGTATDVTAMDFSTDTTLTDVAATIEAAVVSAGFTSADVSHNATTNQFTVTSGTTGVTSTIQFGTTAASGTDISGIGFMEITATTATLKLDGVDAETGAAIGNALSAIDDVSNDWYGLAVTSEIRDSTAEITAAAAWVEARVKFFFVDTDDVNTLDTSITGTIANTLQTSGYRRSKVDYNDVSGEYLAVSTAGRAFTVDFNAPNTTITLKFKQMPGISVANLSTSQKTALDGKAANAYFSVGGNNMYGESFVAASSASSKVFFDEVHGIDWLQNAIETEVFGALFSDPTKTPMTDPGGASLQQRVENALAQGVANGLLAPGFDISGNFLSKGYTTSIVNIQDHSQSSQSARIGPPISFTALGAGAIHSIQINGVFEP